MHALQVFWPVSLCMVLGKLSTYASYVTMSVSLTQTAKALEPLFNVTLAYFVFGERKPLRVVLTLVPVALGVALALTGTANAEPGDPNRPSVKWAKSWKEAVEEASARNVPIFVSFHKDG